MSQLFEEGGGVSRGLANVPSFALFLCEGFPNAVIVSHWEGYDLQGIIFPRFIIMTSCVVYLMHFVYSFQKINEYKNNTFIQESFLEAKASLGIA